MIGSMISKTDFIPKNWFKNGTFLILSLLSFIGYLCESAPVSGTLDCDALYFVHPLWGKVVCSSICPPNKTLEEQKHYCLLNCPVFYKLCINATSAATPTREPRPFPLAYPESSTVSPHISSQVPVTGEYEFPQSTAKPEDESLGLFEVLIIIIPVAIVIILIAILLIVVLCCCYRKMSLRNDMTKHPIPEVTIPCQQETRSHDVINEAEYHRLLCLQSRGMQQEGTAA